MQRRAFTLKELLVVTVVIAVVLFFLHTFFSRSMAMAKVSVPCQANLNGIGKAIALYEYQYDVIPLAARFPSAATDEYPSLVEVLMKGCFVNTKSTFRCIADYEEAYIKKGGTSYEYNWHLGGKASDLSQPHLLVLFDMEPFHRKAGKKNSVNCLRADGSVVSMAEVPDIDQQ